MHHIKLLLLMVISLCLLQITKTRAGDEYKRWNSPRDYEPIILTGSDFPDNFLSVPLNELYVYSYNALDNSWKQIPFQFNEKDGTDDYWIDITNGLLDTNDELTFMARDMGDMALMTSWFEDDDDSKNNDRIEVTVTDTIDGNKQAWVYIYRSTTLELDSTTSSYISYSSDQTGLGADTVSAATYFSVDTTKGINNTWKLTAGTGVDVLDRQKVRLTAFGFLTIKENLLEGDDSTIEVEERHGLVRALRENFWHVDLGFLGAFDFSLPIHYYPYSIESGGVSGNFTEETGVDFLRQTYDLNEAATGMTFYNSNHTDGILIDGSGNFEGIGADDTLNIAPDVNWYLITGNQGSIAFIFELGKIGDERHLYYFDNSSYNGDDTGDQRAYGETGIEIKDDDYLEGKIDFSYKAYYLGPDKPISLGETLANNFKSPLKIDIQTSSFVPVELVTFEAAVVQQEVNLKWSTASESNNYGFEVHRKQNNESEWENIGFVKGHGTSNTPQIYSYIDHNLTSGTYSYRLKQIDFDGKFEMSETIQVIVGAPMSFALEQNYPNPFNPITKINYQVPEQSNDVNLTIYSLLGAKVKTLVSEKQNAGYYTIYWNGKDDSGNIVPSGLYFYRMRSGNFIATKRMILMK